jgi:N-carbamoyl-L-amino-acid hydrolase
MSAPEFRIDADRLMAEIDDLAQWSDAPAPAVTRVLYTEADLAARRFIKGLCTEAGLTVCEDPIGNLFARWTGSDPTLAAVCTGSHIDAIPHSGRYDGTVGVLGAIEAMRALRRAGLEPLRSIELLVFTSEEPTRFGLGCIGSRALGGALTPEALERLEDGSGRSFNDVRFEAGFDGDLSKVRLPAGCYWAFVELHIEQGPILEREGVPIGVVTAIAAPALMRVEWEGEGGHAGAVLMPGRRDALCAAAEAVLAVEQAACGSPDTVATVGICRVHPGASNSIPDRVTIEIDVRDIDGAIRDRVVAQIRTAIATIAERRQVAARGSLINADPPSAMAPPIIAAVEESCAALGLPQRRLVSRAFHDSVFMAQLAPTSMIFIPCRGGVSHRPDEYCTLEEIARGVAVLAGTLARLAVQDDDREPLRSVPLITP